MTMTLAGRILLTLASIPQGQGTISKKGTEEIESPPPPKKTYTPLFCPSSALPPRVRFKVISVPPSSKQGRYAGSTCVMV